MATIELCSPAVADFNRTVARPVPVSDHKVVGEPILHVAYSEMVDVEDPGVPLASSAIMDNDVLPASPAYCGPVDGGTC